VNRAEVVGVSLSVLPRTPFKEKPMKKYLVTAALVIGLATPALAIETFYIMFDNTLNNCSIMDKESTDAKYKMMGKYNSKAEAEAAMKTMKECGGK
jgi:hypothetical protein